MAFAFRSGRCVSLALMAHAAILVPSVACDLTSYSVEKGIELTQSGSGAPLPKSSNAYVFRADMLASGAGFVLAATVAAPGGSTVKTLALSSDNLELAYDKKEDTAAKLNGSFPSGTYVLTVNTAHDGNRVLPLSLQGDAYPATAHLAAFDQSQSLDAGAFSELRWDYLNDGVVPDFVQLRIEDSQGTKVFETADDGPAALDGRANTILLPPGTLAANQAYKATLRTQKTVYADTITYPLCVGTARYYRRVSFPLVTRATATVADARDFSVVKTEIWEQAPGSAPAPAAKNGFIFDATVEAVDPGKVLSAGITTPAEASPLDPNSDWSNFELKDKTDTKNGLDTRYPAGSYSFTVSGATQGQVVAVVQLGPDAYPEPPTFLYPEQALGIDANQDFTFEWQPFAGGTSSDFIQLRLDDDKGNKVFQTSDFEKAKALTGLRVSATVPAGTLAPGKTYTARLSFLKIVDRTTTRYPGALAIAAYAREARMQVRTSGGPPLPPALSAPLFVSGAGFSFWITGSPGTFYRVEFSTDLVTWSPAGTVSLTTAPAQFTVFASGSDSRRYFRLVQQ